MASEAIVQSTARATLGDMLPEQMARVRDKIMPAYVACGPAGGFALTMMRRALDGAAKAMAAGDVVEMLRVYEELKGFSV